MNDDTTYMERLQSKSSAKPVSPPKPETETAEAACNAFGYLRGIRDQSVAVELRFRNGNSTWFPYSWLGPWQYRPSDGLLLKFSGDLVYLVLIHGSNIDRPLQDGTVNLTQAGLQRHRILWIREMSPYEICAIGERAPTIDRIDVAEFENQAAIKEWLERNAPEFSK